MVTPWTTLLILLNARTTETISIMEVDEFLESLGRAGAGVSWDYTLMLQNNSAVQYDMMSGPVRRTHAVCGQMRVENCNALLKVASFVCAYTMEEHRQHNSLQTFMLTPKYTGCIILEYIAAYMLAYAGEVVKIKMNVGTGHRGLSSIQRSYDRKNVAYPQYQDLFPIVCRRIDDREPAAVGSGLVATACNYLRRAGLKYLGMISSFVLKARAKEGLPKTHLPDKENMTIKYETVGMMFPELCRRYRRLPGCAAIQEQVALLVSKVGEIHRTTVGWEMNEAVDKFNDGNCFKLHHSRHFIPFTECQGEARRSLFQCRYLLEDRLEILIPK